MRTVTLHWDNPNEARRASIKAFMHGVVTDSDEIADGYLDIVIDPNERGVRQFMAIRPGATVIAVNDEPINMGEVRTTKLARQIQRIRESLTEDQLAILMSQTN